jgi:hypothetical protein
LLVVVMRKLSLDAEVRLEFTSESAHHNKSA